MKVFMFAPYCYPVPGGQESHVYELMNGLRKKKVDVEIMARYAFSPSKLHTGLYYAQSYYRLPRRGVDLIHGHDIHVGAVLALYKRFHKIPTVLTIHSSVFLETYKMIPRFYQDMFKRQNAIIAVSEEIRRVCQSLTDKKVYYITNGVDTKKFKPRKSNFIQKTCRIPEDATVILTTRRLDKKNNVIALARAFDTLSKKRNDIYLVIVGDGEQRQSIESLQNPRIVITGFVKNDIIPQFLNSADIFVMPSLYEATSISCLEAMASGLPILATNVGGLPELVDDNGILCEPTAPSLSIALEKMLGADRKKMGERSRQIVQQKFSWESITELYLKLYESVL